MALPQSSENPTATSTQNLQPRKAKYVIKLGSGIMGDIVYAGVHFLRGKPRLRGLLFLLDVALVVVLALFYIGVFKVGTASSLTTLVFFFVVPSLFQIAIWSGDDFDVTFRFEEVKKAEDDARKAYETSRSPEDAVRLDELRLNTYYEINQAQAKAIFRWAIAIMLSGFGTIVSGIWLFYFRSDLHDSFMASLSTAAGIVLNLVSGMFLYLHDQTQKRSFQYYGELVTLQRTRIAIDLAQNSLAQGEKPKTLEKIIEHLLQRPFPVKEAERKMGKTGEQ